MRGRKVVSSVWGELGASGCSHLKKVPACILSILKKSQRRVVGALQPLLGSCITVDSWAALGTSGKSVIYEDEMY